MMSNLYPELRLHLILTFYGFFMLNIFIAYFLYLPFEVLLLFEVATIRTMYVCILYFNWPKLAFYLSYCIVIANF